MTRIKCCGMTRAEDALLAARLGTDAIGLVFSARSRRQVTIVQAQAIVRALPPFITVVALFMDDDAGFVREAIAAVLPDLLQFHGNESDRWCAQFGRPFVKAIAMGQGADDAARWQDYPHAAALLLDGHRVGEAGGGGKAFDWSRTPRDLDRPLILAGGLDPDNVAAAIRIARPWAVDVASGIETAPGIKDPARLAAFVRAVRRADAELAHGEDGSGGADGRPPP
jgi:phosphoribosylanthranilate isomerase